ncbi:MAG: hypothetical protein KJZ69_08860 [Phycisphaerales bacterium]|nr:hypothetical protein [Phycisphaerales bacterium]
MYGQRNVMSGTFGLAAMIFATSVRAALAQSGLPAWIEPPEGSVRFGQAVASGADVDGDGVIDIYIADSGYTTIVGHVGRLFVFSGATREVIWSVVGADLLRPMNGAPEYLMPGAFIDDLDGDDVPDLLVGFPAALEGRGMVQVYSGRTGDVLLRIEGEPETTWLGQDVSRLGDLDDDGVDEFAFSRPGRVVLCSGATGEVRDSLAIQWARRVRSLGDVDRDGVADFIVAQYYFQGGFRQVDAFSGRTRDRLWTSAPPNSPTFGYSAAAGYDLTGDEVPDVLVTGDSGASATPWCFVVSGATGEATRFDIQYGIGQRQVNWVALGDLNGDGRVEPIAGYVGDGSRLPPRLNIYDHVPGPGPVERLAYTADWTRPLRGVLFGTEMTVADVTGNGCDDLILGSDNNTGVHIIGGSPMLFGHDHNTHTAFGEREVRRGFTHRFAAVGNAVGRPVRLAVSRRGNGCTFIPQLGICLDLERPFQQIAQAITDADGFARFSIPIPADTTPGPVWMQCLDVNFPRRGPATSNVMRIEIVE